MFAIGIRYLCGTSMAMHPSSRNKPEWPPHPDRLFMALTAAHFETEGPPTQRAALEWLECQPPPAMYASETCHREVVTHYVPVNDTTCPKYRKDKKPSADTLKQALSLLPENRGRQPRTFPVAIPHEDTVYFIWREAELTKEYRRALDDICANVTYLGHSASLVQAWVTDKPRSANLYPSETGAKERLRVTGKGRLERLVAQYEAGLRPTSSTWIGYAPKPEKKTAVPGTVFDRRILVFRHESGTRLGMESTFRLTDGLHKLLLSRCSDPIPEWLSGHQLDGKRTDRPHAAFFPLANVGNQYADGRLLGLAMAIPRETSTASSQDLNEVLFDELGQPQPLKLTLGRLGTWEILVEYSRTTRYALRPDTWTRPATRWASVTPMVLDRNLKTKKGRSGAMDRQIRDLVLRACHDVGLPEPIALEFGQSPRWTGAPHARALPALPRKWNKPKYLHYHVALEFAAPVAGPLLLGAGRYRGYGLFRPYPEPKPKEDE